MNRSIYPIGGFSGPPEANRKKAKSQLTREIVNSNRKMLKQLSAEVVRLSQNLTEMSQKR